MAKRSGMVDHVRDMTAKKSCKYGKYGLLAQLAFESFFFPIALKYATLISASAET